MSRSSRRRRKREATQEVMSSLRKEYRNKTEQPLDITQTVNEVQRRIQRKLSNLEKRAVKEYIATQKEKANRPERTPLTIPPIGSDGEVENGQFKYSNEDTVFLGNIYLPAHFIITYNSRMAPKEGQKIGFTLLNETLYWDSSDGVGKVVGGTLLPNHFTITHNSSSGPKEGQKIGHTRFNETLYWESNQVVVKSNNKVN